MATGTSGLAQKIVEGAYDATEAPQEWISKSNMAKYAETNEQVVSSGGQMVNALVEQKKRREEAENQKQLSEWDKLANSAIEDSQYMTEDEYGTLTNELEADRELFINASKEEKAILLNNMETKRDEIENVKTFRTTLSVSATDEDGIKGNQDWLLSNDGMEYKDILSGEKSMIEEGGKYGYMMYDSSIQEDRIAELEQIESEIELIDAQGGTDGNFVEIWTGLNRRKEELLNEINEADINPRGDQVFKSVYDMEQTIKYQSFDREINNKAVEFATNAQTLGSQVPQGSQANFNYESTYQLIENEITNRGNIRSLMEDKHIGGQSWEQYMVAALSIATYEDLGVDLTSLGIDAETLADLDPTKFDNKITSSDIDGIMMSLKNNKEMTKDYITTYYTNFVQQNYLNGYNSRPKPTPVEDDFDGQNL